MASESNAKGRKLEQAVKSILEVILDSAPEVKGKDCTIETNVLDRSSGVHHEIDVLVTTNSNSDFETKWIFECKNWSQPVDKDVVTVLADKVEALRASKGFLVAHSLTRGAEAQLQKKERLKFIRCQENFSGPLVDVQLTHTYTDSLPIVGKIHFRDRFCSSDLPPLDYSQPSCRWFGHAVDFAKFIENEVGKLMKQDLLDRAGQYNHLGTHWGYQHVILDMEYRELELNGFAVDSLELPLFYFVTTARAKIHSKFELEGKGRFISFESPEHDKDGEKLEFQFIQKF